jgi:hypothetical protein
VKFVVVHPLASKVVVLKQCFVNYRWWFSNTERVEVAGDNGHIYCASEDSEEDATIQ